MKYFENWKNWEKWFYLLSMCSENHLDLVFQVLGGMMLYCIWEKSINGIEYEKNYKQLKIWESKKDYLNTYNHEFIHACACSAVSWLFATLWTIVPQAPLSTGFTRQEYWSRLPFPPSGDLRPPPPRARTRGSCVSCITGRFISRQFPNDTDDAGLGTIF